METLYIIRRLKDAQRGSEILTREFEKLYKLLHIAGYYRGLLDDVNVLKDAFKVAKAFIEKLGKRVC